MTIDEEAKARLAKRVCKKCNRLIPFTKVAWPVEIDEYICEECMSPTMEAVKK